jgi:hypothetical protein
MFANNKKCSCSSSFGCIGHCQKQMYDNIIVCSIPTVCAAFLTRSQLTQAERLASTCFNFPQALFLFTRSVPNCIHFAELNERGSMHHIAGRLTPVGPASGIESLESDTFRLQCFQSPTGKSFTSRQCPISIYISHDSSISSILHHR